MATYVNDLRLKEITTGDESGTWGTSTNTNLELIGEALSYATQDCFSSDADATTTVADGAADPARAMYFKVTSSATLSATRTLTIAPDTISRVMFIENATTGSQSIAISQGSGANVTIATGKTKIVYLDGAGGSAAVVDALAAIEDLIRAGTSVSFTQVDITAQGDLRIQDSSGGEYVALQAPATIASNYTLTLPADDGDADQYLQTNGSGVLDWATVTTTYNTWAIKTGNYTAVSGDQLIVNSGSAVTITLPAGSANDTVIICNAGAGVVTVARTSSQNINSADEDGTINQNGSVQLVYVDGTIGWFPI